MAWTKQQAQLFAKRVKQRSGSAWWAFVPDVREALLDAEVMSVVLGQDRASITVEDIRRLRVDVAVAMRRLGWVHEQRGSAGRGQSRTL